MLLWRRLKRVSSWILDWKVWWVKKKKMSFFFCVYNNTFLALFHGTELMLLGLISLLLGQWASWISRICVNSSLFNSKFFLCSEEDYADDNNKRVLLSDSSYPNETEIPKGILSHSMAHQCGEVSYESFLSFPFILYTWQCQNTN